MIFIFFLSHVSYVALVILCNVLVNGNLYSVDLSTVTGIVNADLCSPSASETH